MVAEEPKFSLAEALNDLDLDLTKHGNKHDRWDMARMGKIQEMRASITAQRPKVVNGLLTSEIEKFQVIDRLWLQCHPHVLVGISP